MIAYELHLINEKGQKECIPIQNFIAVMYFTYSRIENIEKYNLKIKLYERGSLILSEKQTKQFIKLVQDYSKLFINN